jgi:hypothetical protein
MITQKELKELIHYDKETGVFTWINPLSVRVKIGTVANCKSRGYIVIRLKNKLYRSHRLAWLYEYGELPKKSIDHINHNRSDNRICNLRDVSYSENLKNKGITKKNKSGNVGVWFDKGRNKWQSFISCKGKRYNLGRFKNKEDAINAREKKKKELGFHENHN